MDSCELTAQEFRRVEVWLYDVRRLAPAIESLKLIRQLGDQGAASPPTWVSDPDAIRVTGGKQDSRLEKWVEWLDGYESERWEILDKLKTKENSLAGYEAVMKLLQSEQDGGQLCQLVRAKYINRVRPDSAIYEYILFVGKGLFYTLRRYVLYTFFDCLPGEFPAKRAPVDFNMAAAIPSRNP